MADKPYDVGVLVVHGIGSQSKGATLQEFVDPVVDLLDELPGNDGPGSRLRPSPAEGMVGIRASGLGQTDKTQSWLVGEAWWAEAFDVPDRGEVTGWLVGVGPWFALFWVARLWRRFRVRMLDIVAALAFVGALALLVRAQVQSSASAGHVITLVVAAVLLVLIGVTSPFRRAAGTIVVVSLLVIYPLVAIETVAMVAVWLVGLLPGQWSEKVRAFQVSLASSIGDSYALIASPRRERAMFDAITSAASKLVEQLDKDHPTNKRPLVIVAHSQGAALVYRLLKRRDCAFQNVLADRAITLVTHGAAIVPIHVLELRRREHRWHTLISAVLGFAAFLLFALSLGRLFAGEANETTAGLTMSSLAALVVAFALVRGAEQETRCHDSFQPPPGDGSTSDAPIERWRAAEAGGRGLRSLLPVGPASGPPRGADKQRGWGTSADKAGTVGPTVRPPTGETDVAPADGDDHEDRRICPAVPIGSATTLRWVDLWAPWDPVPNGPIDVDHPYIGDTENESYRALPGSSESGFLPCRVANDHQPWVDHVVYRSNAEDVVLRWIGEIALRGSRGDLEPASIEAVLPDDAAVCTRRRRMFVGRVLLAAQGLVVLAGMLAVMNRWDELDDLGRWLQRNIPGPLRTFTGTVADLIPDPLRDAYMGSGRDPAHWQGLAAALAVVALGVAVVTYGFGRVRASNSRRLTAQGASATGYRVLWGVGAALVILTLVGAAWAGTRSRTDERSLDIPVELVLQNGDHVAGDVEFTAADDKDEKISVPIDASGAAVAHLDPQRHYVVSATTTVGKDCTPVSVTDRVRVTCVPLVMYPPR